jgi:cell division protein FtsI/penicillin-binding protein 2
MKEKKELPLKIKQIKEVDYKFGGRFVLIIIFIILIGLLIVGQLFRLQVVFSKKYNNKAIGQYVDNLDKPFERGNIYFTEKDGNLISAATMMSGYKMAVNPSLVKDKEKLFDDIKDYIDVSEEDFLAHFKEGDTYEEIAFRLPLDTVKEIKNKKIQGVYFYPQNWRNYPGGNLASQVLGFVGFNNDKFAGQYGLEKQYDYILSPKSELPFINFFAEVFKNKIDKDKDNKTKTASIVTTIEPTVQSYLEKTLLSLKNTWSSESVGGVIMDPNNGEIIAMANLPDFNPNEFGKEKNISYFSNPIVENIFEIGSVIKILTMTSGLDAGVVTPDTHYNDTGIVTLDTEVIKNAREKSYGYMSMQEVLDKSLNTGAVFVMQKLGRQAFRNYFYSFGLNEKTLIDLPNEVSNSIKNLESPRDIEYATASFGQGIALTPISATRAFSMVANGGFLVTPHLVKKIVYEDGVEKELKYEKSERILKEDTTLRISSMLRKVVDEALLSGTIKLQNHTSGAKTGTAQIATKGGYIENSYLHTMVAYFPVYDPKYIIFIYNKKPQADDFSAKTLGPSVMDIGQFLMNYYNIEGDRK